MVQDAPVRSALSSSLEPDEAPPRCAVHADREVAFTCVRCRREHCADCLFGGAGRGTPREVACCLACAEGGLAEPIPWERRASLGWVRAFVDTTRLVMREPARLFATPTTERGSMGALLYGMAMYTLSNAVTLLVVGVCFAIAAGVAAALGSDEATAIFGVYACVLIGATPVLLVQAPIQGLLGLAIATVGSHGTLAVTGGTARKFEETMRVLAYAYAPLMLLVVPGIGFPIGTLWMIATEQKALRAVHGVTSGRAWLAVLGYRAALLGFVLAIYVAFFAAIFYRVRELTEMAP